MQINKRLITKVDVDKNIEISFLTNFPELSIDFHDVKIHEPGKDNTKIFAELDQISITFDIMNIWNENYRFKHLYLDKGYIHLRTNPDGSNNYTIIKKDSSVSGDATDFSIAFIQLKNVELSYEFKPGFQTYNLFSRLTQASLSYAENIYAIKVVGDWHSEGIYIKDNSFILNKDIRLNTSFTYNSSKNLLTVIPSEVQIDKGKFSLQGKYDIERKNIDLSFKAEKGDIQTFSFILPKQYTTLIDSYQSMGNVYFNGSLKGDLSDDKSPAIDVQFGFENATFYHPEYKQHIKKAYLKGVFSNGSKQELSTTSIKLSDIRFQMDDRDIEGYFYLSNLDDPSIDTHLKGSVQLINLLRIIPQHVFEQASGELDFDIEFKGKTNDLKSKSGYQNIFTAGDLGLNNIVAKIKSYPHTIEIPKALCTFNKNDISINDMSLRVGKNTVDLNGIFRNLIGKLIFEDQSMYIQADLEMGNIYLEDILMADKRTNQSSDMGFVMPLLKDYKMELSLKAASMNYQKFHANNISSLIEWNYPLLTFTNSSLQFCQGDYTGNTSLKVINDKLWEIKTDSKIRNLNIDSLFYVFENFSQNFITDKNIKGQISSDVSLLLQLDNHLDILPASIICDADITIKNGELNNFDPMRKMSHFLNTENLDNIKFSEMKNHFLIYNQEIQIPEMTIVCNVGKIGVSGKHAFNGNIDYRIAYPMKNLKKEKLDPDAAFGAIRQDPKGEMKVHLIIQGTTDNFKITYDKKKTGEKILSDIQKEKNELKALFKKKDDDHQQIKQTQQVDQEYFDF